MKVIRLSSLIVLVLLFTSSAAFTSSGNHRLTKSRTKLLSMKINFQGTPRRFYVESSNLGKIAASSFQFLLRLGSGAFVQGYTPALVDDIPGTYSILKAFGKQLQESPSPSLKKPALPIQLYEFEGCPFCKKVREATAILDLDVLFYPCPKGGPTFRPAAIKEGGKRQFPYMVDPNTGESMYESDDIIEYLFDTYGGGESIPTSLTGGFITTLTCSLGLLPRLGKGSAFDATSSFDITPGKGTSKGEERQPLIYWGYEASPFCKIVRERLNELEIPHVAKNCARGSPKRQELFEKTGTFQVPFIEDPNTGVNMFESGDILRYLDKTYTIQPQ